MQNRKHPNSGYSKMIKWESDGQNITYIILTIELDQDGLNIYFGHVQLLADLRLSNSRYYRYGRNPTDPY